LTRSSNVLTGHHGTKPAAYGSHPTAPVVTGLKEQLIGLNYQVTADQFGIFRRGGFLVTPSVAVHNENSEPIAAGSLDDPAKQFREFAAECMELAQATRSPEKRSVYLEMARVWHQMALRWENKIGEGSAKPEASVKSDGV
jgi:hypothetical protein